ncbi:hypothetical protein [Caudoviricetes sp.]|nr:hypothetical protein [Caudoviricetes sp.]
MKIGAPTISKMPVTIHLDSKDLPDIVNWKPGNKYRIMLLVEQTNMSVGDPYPEPGKKSNNNTISATFKVLNAKAIGNKNQKGAIMNAMRRRAQSN